jgi:type IV pilus assembly protein PilN
MIRINLLPVKKAKKKKKLPRAVVLTVLVLLLSIVTMSYLWYYQHSENKRLDNDIQRTNAELSKLVDVAKLVDKFEKDKKELDRKIDIIVKLHQGQQRPVRLLEVINRALPEDIWLSNITTSDVNVKISGYALTTVGVSHFMTRLKESPYFKNVDLVESAATTFERSTVYRFDLNCVLSS